MGNNFNHLSQFFGQFLICVAPLALNVSNHYFSCCLVAGALAIIFGVLAVVGGLVAVIGTLVAFISLAIIVLTASNVVFSVVVGDRAISSGVLFVLTCCLNGFCGANIICASGGIDETDAIGC